MTSPDPSATLLAVTRALAPIRSRQQLGAVFTDSLHKLFPYDAASVWITEAKALGPFDMLQPDPLPGLPAGEELPVAGLLEQPQPLLLTGAGFAGQYRNHRLLAPHLQAGMQALLAAPLRAAQNEAGLLCFFSKSPDAYGEKELFLFRAITDLVAVAVANILANEEILEREHEKSVLLSISEKLASIRDKNELLVVIEDFLKPVFRFEEAVLTLYSADLQFAQHYNLITADNPQGSYYRQIVSGPVPLLNSPHQEFINYAGPRIVDFEHFRQQYPDHVGIKVMDEMGLVQSCMMPLNHRNHRLGMLEFHARRKDQLGKYQLSIYRNLADQVAVAVANILAHEEILQQKADIEAREREKIMLLSISETIANVRQKGDLLDIISEHVKPIFGFEFSAVVLLNEDDTHQAFLLHGFGETKPDTALQKAATERNPVWDGVAERVLQSGKAGIFSAGEMLRQHPQVGYLQFLQLHGIREMMTAALRYQNQPIGLLYLYSRETGRFGEGQLPLFQAIADQVAVAVANVLANEEILEREREKTLQIEVTNALTTLPSWQERFETVARLIDEAAPFELFTISFHGLAAPQVFTCRKTTEGNFRLLTREEFWHKLDISREEFTGYLKQIQPHYRRSGLYVGEAYVQACEQYTLKALQRNAFGTHSSVVVPLNMATSGKGECVLILSGKDPNGFSGRQFALIEQLALQIALALDKVVAFEDIDQRAREQSLQLSVTAALTRENDWKSRFLETAKILQVHIPFDYLVIGLADAHLNGKGYGIYRTGYQEYQVLGAAEFIRRARLTPQAFAGLLAKSKPDHSQLLNGADFARHCTQNPLKELIARTFNLRSNLLFTLPLSRAGEFRLSFFSRHEAPYHPDHLQLLSTLLPTLEATLDKLLAFEEIETLSQQLKQDNRYLTEEIKSTYNFEEILGVSPAVREVFDKVSLVAPTDATVLLLGETGTGKELFARAIHNHSLRKARPLIKVNCAALPANLIESELFGHEKGAFTGATDRRIGKFELAHQSTIFLDEIGELPLELQAKLLRVLQEKEVERLGGKGVIKTDVRVVAATNRNLEQEVQEGRFRLDLYYRLNVFPITIPSLRERREDIPLLAGHFARKFSKRQGKPFLHFSPETAANLLAYHWPGNVRELENAVEGAMVRNRDGILHWQLPAGSFAPASTALPSLPFNAPLPGELPTRKDQLERQAILAALAQTKGRIGGENGAARLLGLKRTTLEYRIKVLGIAKKDITLPPADPRTLSGFPSR